MATPKSAFVPHKNVPRSPRLEMAVADYSGIQAPPEITYENYFFWYPATKFKDQNGNNAPINGLTPDVNGEGNRCHLPTNSYGANLTGPAARMTLYYCEGTATSRLGQGPNAEKFYGIRTDVENPGSSSEPGVTKVGS
jgi:hypothetical protein